MARRVIALLIAAGVCLGMLTGCGGGRERGKNQDLDRPRAAEPTKK